jgi:hypothetical protein
MEEAATLKLAYYWKLVADMLVKNVDEFLTLSIQLSFTYIYTLQPTNLAGRIGVGDKNCPM